MTITTIGLFLLALGYAIFLFYDELIQHYRFGKALLVVRLKRRVADAVFMALIIGSGLYYELTQGNSVANQALLGLLMMMVLYHGFRYPKWRLKAEGFTVGGRYWRYHAIQNMQLSEDGVLVIVLHGGQQLLLPAVFLPELERAAAFLAGTETLDPFLSGNAS